MLELRINLTIEMNAPGKFEKGFILVLLVLSTGAFMNLYLKPGTSLDQRAGIPLMQVIWVALYAMVLYYQRKESMALGNLFLGEWALLALVTLVIVSSLWSDAMALTLRRGIALLGTTLTGFYIAVRYTFADQLKLLTATSKIAIVLSFFFGILNLGTSVDQLPGAWYGIYTQRNTLGMTMALSAIVFFLWERIRPSERWTARLWMILSLVLIILSGSMTALVSLCTVVLIFLLLRFMRLRPRRVRTTLLAGSIAMGLGLYYVANHAETTAEALNRDISLTGRTAIWGAALLEGADRPWLGYGFDAFWLGDGGPAADVWRTVGWEAPGAHNGFLDLWLSLGLVGLAIFLVGFVICFRKSSQYFLSNRSWDAAWPVLFLVFLVLINLTQNALVSPNYIFWILYVAIFTRLSILMKTAPSASLL